MAGVVGDPDEIENFAQQLAVYCEYSRANLHTLIGHLNRMADDGSWSDDVYRRYRDIFDDATSTLQRTLDKVSEDHVQHLRGVVEDLRDYLNRSGRPG